MLATLLLSFGVPMLLGGDELGRTQQGNNNAYCQDNEITWFDWASADKELLDFTRRLIALRKAHPVFRRRRFLSGAEASELRWFSPTGTEMKSADWADGSALAIALYLNGADDPDRAADGTPMLDDDFLVLVNAWWEPLDFVLPAVRENAAWRLEVDTYDPAATGRSAAARAASAAPSFPGPSSCSGPAPGLTRLNDAGPGASPGPASSRLARVACPGPPGRAAPAWAAPPAFPRLSRAPRREFPAQPTNHSPPVADAILCSSGT